MTHLDSQASLDVIYDATLRKRITEILGDGADDATAGALFDAAQKRLANTIREREHYRGAVANAIKAGKRSAAALGLATAYAWTIATGTSVRVEPDSGAWAVYVDGVFQAESGRPDAALDLAARIAQPDDVDLAALLTWTACGRPRV